VPWFTAIKATCLLPQQHYGDVLPAHNVELQRQLHPMKLESAGEQLKAAGAQHEHKLTDEQVKAAQVECKSQLEGLSQGMKEKRKVLETQFQGQMEELKREEEGKRKELKDKLNKLKKEKPSRCPIS
jgi:hypothetical protein